MGLAAPLEFSVAAGSLVVPPKNTAPLTASNDNIAAMHTQQQRHYVQVSRIINFTLFFVMSTVIVGAVFVGLPSYGVFGDEYLWMKYQVSRRRRRCCCCGNTSLNVPAHNNTYYSHQQSYINLYIYNNYRR